MSDETNLAEQLEQSRAETRAAFANRALVYSAIFDELVAEIGRDRAVLVMKKAIHRRGLAVGLKYREAGEAGDLEEVGRIFCEGSPCGGSLFTPGVEDRSESAIVLRMTSCPLVDAWRDEGRSDAEIDTLCEVAAAVDEGTFESAGLDLVFLDRLGKPGSEHCLLDLKTHASDR